MFCWACVGSSVQKCIALKQTKTPTHGFGFALAHRDAFENIGLGPIGQEKKTGLCLIRFTLASWIKVNSTALAVFNIQAKEKESNFRTQRISWEPRNPSP